MENHAPLSEVRVEVFTTDQGTAREQPEKGVNLSDAHQKTFAPHCRSCGSQNVVKLRGEIAMRFPGLKNIDVPIVQLFPEIVACLNCAAAEFAVPEAELHMLARQKAATGCGINIPEFDEESPRPESKQSSAQSGCRTKSQMLPKHNPYSRWKFFGSFTT